MTRKTKISQILAPEEIRKDQFVTVLHQIIEQGPMICPGDDTTLRSTAPIRMQFLPDEGDLPMQVRAVCLPFVLATRADGMHRVLDVRRHRLALLTKRFGRKAFKRLRSKKRKRRCNFVSF